MEVLTLCGYENRVNTLTTEQYKSSCLLDLFQAGYKNAYVSVIDLYSRYNRPLVRIEMIVPNVGSLRLYQTFVEIDEQIPDFKVFYTSADKPFVRTMIKKPVLLNRAIRIIYGCKKYFETHPDTEKPDSQILSIIKSNKRLVDKKYKQILETRNQTLVGRVLF